MRGPSGDAAALGARVGRQLLDEGAADILAGAQTVGGQTRVPSHDE
jgi:hypothetical protein